MADFLTGCACNGSKPRRLSESHFFYRNALLSRMMRDRSKVRYLEAPSFFGKTFLAGSYAHLVFEFKHTFWINADSPCFLRDLDAEVMTESLLEQGQRNALVVFDDVPAMDDSRLNRFWNVCETLLAHEWEVVVASTPTANPLRSHRDECIVLPPQDFLFDDVDFEELRAMDIETHRILPPRCRADRVPGLARHAPESYERFLTAQISEATHAIDVALLFSLLTVENGTFEDLAYVLNRQVEFDRFDAQDAHPYVVMDSFRHEFDASGFPLREAIRAFSPHMQRIADAVGESDVSSTVSRIADVLVRRGLADRAAQILIALCQPAPRAAWLDANQHALTMRGDLLATQVVFESLRTLREGKRPALACGSAARLCLLDSPDEGMKQLYALARRADLPLDDRLRAASVILLFEGDVRHPDGALADLRDALAREAVGARDGNPSSRSLLQQLWSASGKWSGDGVARFLRTVAAVPDSDDAALVLTCAIRLLRANHVEPRAPHHAACSKAAARLFERFALEGPARVSELLLKREVECSDALGTAFSPVARRKIWQRCEALETSLQVQSAAYARARGEIARRTEGIAAIATLGRVQSTHLQGPPVLRVKLFGGFDVRLGDKVVPANLLSRQKVRTLLALLVLNGGKDLSCQRLSEMLWPDSPEDKARRNFYSIWSLLHKALRLPTGDCPYLVRIQGICRLDAHLVHSDAGDIAEICRRMTYEKPEVERFLHLLEQAKSAYRGELLPGEQKTHIVEMARIECRNRLVDAALTATLSLERAGHRAEALKYAKQVLAWDGQREDAYQAVMRLQVDCGQRPAAVETWLSYCRVISGELGLEPSHSMRGFYSDIIGTQPPDFSDIECGLKAADESEPGQLSVVV